MNKLFLGLVLGLVAGYAARCVKENVEWDDLGNEINRFASKGKKKINNLIDHGKNEIEYLKDRIEYNTKKEDVEGI